MEVSIFTDKNLKPGPVVLQKALGSTYELWMQLEEYILSKYPLAVKEWSCPVPKYGWNYRMKDNKRVIMYFLPRRGFFKAAFVFGEKAYDEIMSSSVGKKIKDDLEAARPYAEGRGIRIEVNKKPDLKDIYKLVDIKLSN